MTGKIVCLLAGLGLALTLTASGCAKSPPPVTEVSGIVLLDGQPLPQARVEFVPDLENFGSAMNSSATTDDKGRFTLTCANNGNPKPGAVVGKHFVLVSELPLPKEARGQDERSQAKLKEFQAKLKNRPIPQVLSAIGKNPYTIEVKEGQKNYEIKLTRPPEGRKRD
jgi:hypothetical protein